MKKEKLIKEINKGINVINEDIKAIEYLLETEKHTFLKKSLINRLSFLKKELKIGKEFLKLNS